MDVSFEGVCGIDQGPAFTQGYPTILRRLRVELYLSF